MTSQNKVSEAVVPVESIISPSNVKDVDDTLEAEMRSGLDNSKDLAKDKEVSNQTADRDAIAREEYNRIMKLGGSIDSSVGNQVKKLGDYEKLISDKVSSKKVN